MKMMLAAWRMNLDYQAQMLQLLNNLQSAQSQNLNSDEKMRLPIDFMDENRMREMFHTLADNHLKQWEEISEIYQTLPAWMRQIHGKPGSYMTDFFDKFQQR